MAYKNSNSKISSITLAVFQQQYILQLFTINYITNVTLAVNVL